MVLNNYTPGPGQYKDSSIHITFKREPNSIIGKAGRSFSSSNLAPGRIYIFTQRAHTLIQIPTDRATKIKVFPSAVDINSCLLTPREFQDQVPTTLSKSKSSDKKEHPSVLGKEQSFKQSMNVKFSMLQAQKDITSLRVPLSKKAAYLDDNKELVWHKTVKIQVLAHILSTISLHSLSFQFLSQIQAGSKELPTLVLGLMSRE